MEKKLLASWGNNISKEISFTDKISQGVINVGNQNSYGDCFIPKSLHVIKSEKLDTEKIFFFFKNNKRSAYSKQNWTLWNSRQK